MSFFHWITGTVGYTAIFAALAMAVLAHFFAPRSWSALAWSIAVGALALAFVGQRELTATERAAHEKTKVAHAQVIADVATKTAEAHRLAVAAEQQVTERERALAETIESNSQEARRVQKTLEADRDRADAAARSLRQQLDQIARRFGAGDEADAVAAAAGERSAAGDAIGVLADVLGRCDERQGVLAAFADEAHAAGLACERNYDAARAALTPTLGLNSGGS